ncbi:MAG: pyrimidine utilization regulatory protein R [Rhodospirillales bacterium 69-11]|nr:TetR family transcriptional regulator C-terminal domain-containing protein [Rhodospirillales bacterium]OJW23130.1 MAG: pyrimidine utilization regulatory protein R [Rhodospirillales bacterium 69-11]
MTAFAEAPTRRERMAQRKRAVILDAALDLFSRYGVEGTTLEAVAQQADVSKSNLIYYFSGKEALYAAVLADVLEGWLVPLDELRPDADPAAAIRAYIAKKMEFSRDNPAASRLFCLEVMQGAPVLDGRLRTVLRPAVDAKAAVIRHWIEAGLIAPIDPHQMIFSLWATTQHFADFATQIRALRDRDLSDPDFYEDSVAHVTELFLGRLRPLGA